MENNNVNNNNVNDTNEKQENNEVKTTYTKEEVDKLIQAEADRRVTSALKKAKKEAENDKAEAIKVALMDEQEKAKYELEQKEKTLAEREKNITLIENKNKAIETLNSKGIDISLADIVVSDNEEDMNKKIDILTKTFNECVKKEVENRLSSQSPKKGGETLPKENSKKMSYKELMDLKRTDPEAFKAIRH